MSFMSSVDFMADASNLKEGFTRIIFIASAFCNPKNRVLFHLDDLISVAISVHNDFSVCLQKSDFHSLAWLAWTYEVIDIGFRLWRRGF